MRVNFHVLIMWSGPLRGRERADLAMHVSTYFLFSHEEHCTVWWRFSFGGGSLVWFKSWLKIYISACSRTGDGRERTLISGMLTIDTRSIAGTNVIYVRIEFRRNYFCISMNIYKTTVNEAVPICPRIIKHIKWVSVNLLLDLYHTVLRYFHDPGERTILITQVELSSLITPLGILHRTGPESISYRLISLHGAVDRPSARERMVGGSNPRPRQTKAVKRWYIVTLPGARHWGAKRRNGQLGVSFLCLSGARYLSCDQH